MRGITSRPFEQTDVADMTPEEAQFALTVQESPLPQIMAISKQLDLEKTGPMKNPPELNQMFPDLAEPITEPMTVAAAANLNERAQIRNNFKKNISYAPNTLGSGVSLFTAGMVGSLVDPVSNTAMFAVGPAFKAAGLVGKTLGQRIGYSIAENFLGNMTADVTAASASHKLQDEFNPAQRVGMNLAAATVFGVPMGFAEHYFRAAPEFGNKVADMAASRAATGLDPEFAKTAFDAVIAAENSGTHFPYEQGPFDQSKPFYSGSRNFTENFRDAAHAVRADIGAERGVQLFDNENIAHAGALTIDSGKAGAVFEHDLSGKTIIDGNIKLSEMGTPEAVASTDKALQRHSITGDVNAATDIELLGKALGEARTGKFALEDLAKLHGDLADSFLSKTMNDLGMYNAYRAFEDFAGIAKMRRGEIPFYSLHDVIMLMDKEIQNTTDKKLRTALVTKYKDFVEAIRADAGTKLGDLGNQNLVVAYKQLTDAKLRTYKDITLAQAYKEIIAAYHEGRISLADVTSFEKSIGADGLHFSTDNFRGNSHATTNGVYIFDRSSLDPGPPKIADVRAVGGVTPDRINQMNVDVNGQRKIFDYGPNKKTGEDMWNEVKKKSRKVSAQEELIPVTEISTKKDADFAEVKKELNDIKAFDQHLDQSEVAALDAAQAKFSLANKMESMYAKVIACLR